MFFIYTVNQMLKNSISNFRSLTVNLRASLTESLEHAVADIRLKIQNR